MRTSSAMGKEYSSHAKIMFAIFAASGISEDLRRALSSCSGSNVDFGDVETEKHLFQSFFSETAEKIGPTARAETRQVRRTETRGRNATREAPT